MFGNQFKFGSGVLKHPGYNKGKGGGGGGGNTTATTYSTNIPEYAKPYVQSMLGAAQSEMFNIDSSGNITGTKPYVPYSTNPEDYVAGFSPLQQTSFNRAAGLGVPSQFGQATQLGGAAGLGSLGLAGQAAGAGQQFQNMATNPYAVQAYMNPYLEASLNPQLDAIRRQYDINQTQQQGAATQAGAFGGSREALMAAENRRAMNSAMNAKIGEGYNTAFQNAQGQMQFGANLGLQGLGQGMQGLGQAGQIAAGLGNLGTNQLAAQQGIINTQNLLGTQQQQQQQNIINQSIQDYATAQQYPMMQLGNMSNLLRGLPMQSTSTQTYQAAPSMLSQVAGLGTGIAGAAQLMKAEGGTVKSYAGGGITSLDNREAIAQDLHPKQLEKVQPRTLPDYIRIPLLAEKLQQQQAAQTMQGAQQANPNQPTIKDEILAQAQGIDAANSGMPSQGFAGGGIVAFAQGGYQAPKFDFKPEPLDTTVAKQLYEEAMNPLTDKRYTEEEIIARQRAKEEGLGIKDIYSGQLEDIQKEKAGLEGQKDRALGLSLLSASGKMLGSTSPFALTGIGEGLGEFSTKYGSALDKIDANKIAMRKDENAIMAAQQQMKQAQMAGDAAAYKAAEDKYTSAITNYSNAQNENTKLANAARETGRKAEYEREGKMDIAQVDAAAKIAAAKASQSPFTGETNLRVSLTSRAELVNKAMDDLNAEFKTSMSGWLGKDPSELTGANKTKYQQYTTRKNAIIESVRAQLDPVIKDQMKKLGKTDDEIKTVIDAIAVAPTAGAGGSGNAGSVMKFDAQGNPVKN
jgi:hypothetical protein